MTISINLSLPHGWAKDRPMQWFSSYAHRNISTNKAFEWQTDYFGWTNLFSIQLDLIPTGSDHAGVGFDITVLGFMISAKVYDGRHWDTENHQWEKYDDESNANREREFFDKRVMEVENARRLLKDEASSLQKLELSEFMQTPKGMAMIDQIVQRQLEAKLAADRQAKEDKKARGEEHRRRNLTPQ